MHIRTSLKAFWLIAGVGPFAASAGRAAVLLPPGLADAAREVGITPATLVACGFTQAQGAALVGRLADAEGLQAQLAAAHASLEATTQQYTELRRQRLADPTNESLATQLQNARQLVDNCEQSISDARAQMWGAALSGVSQALVARLTNCQAGADHNAPPEFWVVQRTADDWASLEAALTVERRCVRIGGAVPNEVSGLLAEARAQADVVAAHAGLQMNVPAMQALFQP